MNKRLLLAISILGLTAAGCAGDPTIAAAGATLASAPAVDAAPVRTFSDDAVRLSSGAPVTGRDWNCRGCYK